VRCTSRPLSKMEHTGTSQAIDSYYSTSKYQLLMIFS
jgi:hypothetical protein